MHENVNNFPFGQYWKLPRSGKGSGQQISENYFNIVMT
jgi:hypothetical protein